MADATILPPSRERDNLVFMSKAETLEELPRLTPEERQEIRTRLAELDDAWDDGGELTEEQKQLIESRIADHERHPELAVPWREFERRLNERLGERASA